MYKSQGEVYVLTQDEGGRNSPFFSNYRPQFYFRTTDVTGVITLPEGDVYKRQVAYRETIRKAVMNQEYTHKKQTGGSGQFAKVLMNFEPLNTDCLLYTSNAETEDVQSCFA